MPDAQSEENHFGCRHDCLGAAAHAPMSQKRDLGHPEMLHGMQLPVRGASCEGRWAQHKRKGTLRAKSPFDDAEQKICCSAEDLLPKIYFVATATPACSASLAALSVASQVNSGSVRPK